MEVNSVKSTDVWRNKRKRLIWRRKVRIGQVESGKKEKLRSGARNSRDLACNFYFFSTVPFCRPALMNGQS